ncbi:HIT family protein [Parageobacillus toebii]|uniref:Diadenosine tetraphosphate (Ap4A) HIT family hydrolase n=1 Tax=Parageobacillus toebii NBRC 107807 TaxID=1223503 RepID=A0AA89NKP6_9BACL|nr:HIT family protein [Parageobacillus toebii]MBB3869478.1 diadenosine tetraphosphate (Ap4A) HIT family hydrolase [Parageobacillus toebii NBRC 107807]
MVDCLGCRIAHGLEPTYIIYDDELVTCVLDIDPFNEGHMLILPKQHIRELEEMDEELSLHVMKTSQLCANVLKQRYGADGITICQNGGVFNDLGHYHMHVIPRFIGDGFTWSESQFDTGEKQRLAETAANLKIYFHRVLGKS